MAQRIPRKISDLIDDRKITPADMMSLGSPIFIIGPSVGGNPSQDTQNKINKLISDGWHEDYIVWISTGESYVKLDSTLSVPSLFTNITFSNIAINSTKNANAQINIFSIDAKMSNVAIQGFNNNTCIIPTFGFNLAFNGISAFATRNANISVPTFGLNEGLSGVYSYGTTIGHSDIPQLNMSLSFVPVTVTSENIIPVSNNGVVPSFNINELFFSPAVEAMQNANAGVVAFVLNEMFTNVGVNITEGITPVNTSASISSRILGLLFNGPLVAENPIVPVSSFGVNEAFNTPSFTVQVPSAYVPIPSLNMIEAIGDLSVIAVARTPQAAPDSLTNITGTTGAQMKLSWPGTAGAVYYTLYYNSYGPITGSEPLTTIASNGVRSCKITGLTQTTATFLYGSLYTSASTNYFGISATNSSGAESPITTLTINGALSGGFYTQMYTVTQDQQIKLVWYADPPAQSYNVYYRKGSSVTGSETTTSRDVNSGKFSGIATNGLNNITYYIRNGLTVGATYYVAVTSSSDVSEGKFSGSFAITAGAPIITDTASVPAFNAAISFNAPTITIAGFQADNLTVPAFGMANTLDKNTAVTAQDLGAPPQVTGVVATSGNPLNVNWNPVSWRTPVTYNVYYNSTNTLTGATKITGLSATNRDLNIATGTYYIWVSATTSVGVEGPTSASSTGAMVASANMDVTTFNDQTMNGWSLGFDSGQILEQVGIVGGGSDGTGYAYNLGCSLDDYDYTPFDTWIKKQLQVRNGDLTFMAKRINSSLTTRLDVIVGSVTTTFYLTNTWTQYTVNITNATGANMMVYFKNKAGTTGETYMRIDNISVPIA